MLINIMAALTACKEIRSNSRPFLPPHNGAAGTAVASPVTLACGFGSSAHFSIASRRMRSRAAVPLSTHDYNVRDEKKPLVEIADRDVMHC